MGNRVTSFEIGAEDGPRAKKFYQSVFGWEFEKWAGKEADDMTGWMIKTGSEAEPGIEGVLLLRSENPKTGQEKAFFCTISVADLDATIKKIEQAGGKILDKMESEDMGRFASAEDSEGNKFGIMESNKK
jgi:uncharacterized protein